MALSGARFHTVAGKADAGAAYGRRSLNWSGNGDAMCPCEGPRATTARGRRGEGPAHTAQGRRGPEPPGWVRWHPRAPSASKSRRARCSSLAALGGGRARDRRRQPRCRPSCQGGSHEGVAAGTRRGESGYPGRLLCGCRVRIALHSTDRTRVVAPGRWTGRRQRESTPGAPGRWTLPTGDAGTDRGRGGGTPQGHRQSGSEDKCT
jgi:hypothetical protein